MFNADLGVGCNSDNNCHQNCDGTPDFCIKRNDTMPPLRIAISDCYGAVDLTDENLALEANMWFEAKLKTNIDESDISFSFADHIGFDQISVGDVIVTGRSRNPERMLVIDIDEYSKTVFVERAYDGTASYPWKKGTVVYVFKFTDEPAEIESVFEDIEDIEGNIQTELVETYMVYNWSSGQTDLPGCYWLEFKLMRLKQDGSIEWVKRFPLEKDGFLINIIDSSSPNTYNPPTPAPTPSVTPSPTAEPTPTPTTI